MSYYFRSFLLNNKKKEYDHKKLLKNFCISSRDILPSAYTDKFLSNVNQYKPDEYLDAFESAIKSLVTEYNALVEVHHDKMRDAIKIAADKEKNIDKIKSIESPPLIVLENKDDVCNKCSNESSLFRSNKSCISCSKCICVACSSRVCNSCVDDYVPIKNKAGPKIIGPKVPKSFSGPPPMIFETLSTFSKFPAAVPSSKMPRFDEPTNKENENSFNLDIVPLSKSVKFIESVKKSSNSELINELKNVSAKKAKDRNLYTATSPRTGKALFSPTLKKLPKTPTLMDDLKDNLGKRRKTLCSTEMRLHKRVSSTARMSSTTDDYYDNAPTFHSLSGLSHKLEFAEKLAMEANALRSPGVADNEWN